MLSNHVFYACIILAVCLFTQILAPWILPPCNLVALCCLGLGWLCTTIALSSLSTGAADYLSGLVVLIVLVCLVFVRSIWVAFMRLLLFPCVFILLVVILNHFQDMSVPRGCAYAILCAQAWSFLSGFAMVACYPNLLWPLSTSLSDLDANLEGNSTLLADETGCTITRNEVKQEWGLSLDTVEVLMPHATSKWVLYLQGNGERMEEAIYEVGKMAAALSANAIVFNPRGVGRSTGYPLRVSNFVEDAAAVARFYMQKHDISEEFFLLYGHSFGGGVAGELAKHHFSQAPLVIDRSFSTLRDAASSVVPYVGMASTLLVGDLSAIGGWNHVCHQRKLIIFSRKDNVISFEKASIARLPQFGQNREDAMKAVELTTPWGVQWHNSPIRCFNEGTDLLCRISELFPASEVRGN